jgi:phosphopantothenoylcysteine decarboxylase / phosphopantothenate---cysteine ligase
MSRTSAPQTAGRPRLLITAGPTHEPIDAVRYLGNRSSGRMGIALAEQAAMRSLPTTLLLGPTQLLPASSSHLTVIRFQTTAELHELLLRHWPQHDVLIMAAAVADFRPILPPVDQTDPNGPASVIPAKLRRSDEPFAIMLEPTPDLLASLADQTRPDQFVIGFALEPADELLASAKDKLKRKRLDAIVANPLETMDAATVTATVLLRSGAALPAPANLPKEAFAKWLLDQLPVIQSQPAESPR